MLGIGGGIIYVVVFQYWLDHHFNSATLGKYYVQIIILNSLVAIVFSASTGLWKQSQKNPLDYKMIVTAGFPAALVALLSTVMITNQHWYDRETFLLIFTLLLIPMLLRLIPTKNESIKEEVSDGWLVSGGLFAGLATSLSGLGGGVVLHPYLHGLGRLNMRKSIPLSLGVMIFSALSIIIYHLIFGQMLLGIKGIVPGLVIPVVLGNIITAPLGVSLSQKMSVKSIKWIFVCFTLLLISRNLYLIFH
jgi:uncharacterized membrane protein YfcA